MVTVGPENSLWWRGWSMHVYGPTHFVSKQGPSLLNIVITHTVEDIAYLNILPRLENGDCAVSSFVFRACKVIYDWVKLLPNVLSAKISGMKECIVTTRCWVNTSSLIEEAWSILKGGPSLVTPPFITSSLPLRSSNCPPWISKQVKKLLNRRKRLWSIFITTGTEQHKSDPRSHATVHHCRRQVTISQQTRINSIGHGFSLGLQEIPFGDHH